MSRPITASDRSSLIKQKTLRAALSSEGLLKQASGPVRSFTRGDWMGWAGAEAWKDGEQPFIAEITIDFPWEKLERELNFTSDYLQEDRWDVTIVGDSQGVGIYFSGHAQGDQGPMFNRDIQHAEPEEIRGAMEAAIQKLRSKAIPPGFRHDN